MEKIKLEQPSSELAATLQDLMQQITVLALALGCQLKATGHRSPEKAEVIEENFKELLTAHDLDTWQPRAKGLIDLLLSAMQERSENG